MDAVEKRVHTFVRVKPTANFAQDMIKFGPDNKVEKKRLQVWKVWNFISVLPTEMQNSSIP